MIQRNPDFSTYSSPGGRGPNGVIWLKRVECGFAPDGGVERQTMWILLGRRGLPPKWLSWNVPVPQGGKAEILEASVYSPGEAEIIREISNGPMDQGPDGAVRSVTFSDLPDEFILVVHYREVFPEKLSIDDLVWTSESLPVWETVIRVTAPAGHPFYHFSSQSEAGQGQDPREERIGDRMVYEWRLINTAAEVNPSIRATGREYVAFGSRSDRGMAARVIKAAEGAQLPPPPAVVRGMFGKKSAGKTADNVLSWLYEQPGIHLTNEPREITADMEAPWTTREKVLLAHSWLKEAGVGVRLLWRLAYGPGDGKPFSEAAIVGPVLEVSPDDSKKGVFYCDMKRPPRAGGNESLLNETLYGLAPGAGDSLEERRPAQRKAAENRLSADFNLSLSEDGVVAGAVKITAQNAWSAFLFPEKPTGEDLAEWMKSMFTQVPRYSDITFKELKTGSEVTVKLSGNQVIKGTGGNHILAQLPPLIPEWFKSLSSGPFPYNLSFPFVMDVRVTLALPSSATNVVLPSQIPLNAGKVKYSESYKLDKRKRFIAEARIAVETTSISGDEAARLSYALENWQSFMTKYLPVRLKAR